MVTANKFRYGTQREVCAAFWEAHPHLPSRLIREFSGDGQMFVCDTRCAFVDFVDALQKRRSSIYAIRPRARRR